jgi:hypothetical protein
MRISRDVNLSGTLSLTSMPHRSLIIVGFRAYSDELSGTVRFMTEFSGLAALLDHLYVRYPDGRVVNICQPSPDRQVWEKVRRRGLFSRTGPSFVLWAWSSEPIVEFAGASRESIL